jgi:hypothetical protein
MGCIIARLINEKITTENREVSKPKIGKIQKSHIFKYQSIS